MGLPIFSLRVRIVIAIEDVAAQGVGHFEVAANELAYDFALFYVEVEAGEDAVGEFDGLHGVFAGAAGFAGVVEKDREEEQVETVHFREQSTEPFGVVMQGTGGWLAQGMNIVDGEEGVFIDGVAVVAVANNERINAMELGNQHFENAEGMHGAEGVGGVGTEQNFAKVIPEVRAFGDVDGEDGERVGDAVFRGLGEGVAVVADGGEDAEQPVGVGELRGWANVDAALVEEEIGALDGGTALAELFVEADRRGQVFHQQHGAAVDGARVTIIGAHPVGGVGGAAGFEADAEGGCFVL